MLELEFALVQGGSKADAPVGPLGDVLFDPCTMA